MVHRREKSVWANALVEFALTVPLFFLMVWAFLDLARLETGQILFRKHGHDLARHLASSTLPEARLLEEESRRWSISHGWRLSDVRITIVPISVDKNPGYERRQKIVERLTLDLIAPFSPMSPLMLALHRLRPFHQHVVIDEVRVYAP